MTNYNKIEKAEAERDKATLVPNSGRGKYQKGDAKWDQFLIDYKFNTKSFSFNLKNWLKLRMDALRDNKRSPLICIKFEDGTKVGIIEWEHILDYKELLDAARKV